MPRVTRGISKDVHERVKELLQAYLLGFMADSVSEDPKHFIARMTAAGVVMEHLKALAELAGESAEDGAETSPDDMLAEARDAMAREEKT
jgi:uncharacterized protein (DUF2252 family)